MPAAISQLQIDAPPSVLRRKPWTRADVRAVASTGAFDGRRYELIEGALLDKMPPNPPHVYFLHMLASWLRSVFGELAVRTNSPIDVAPEDNPTSEPEPDICVTAWTLGERQARSRYRGTSSCSWRCRTPRYRSISTTRQRSTHEQASRTTGCSTSTSAASPFTAAHRRVRISRSLFTPMSNQ